MITMKVCPKCNTQHSRPGRFCGRSCSNSRSWTISDRLKKSEAALTSPHVQSAYQKRAQPKEARICVVCSLTYYVRPNSPSRFCSRTCFHQNEHVRIWTKKAGGYRLGSGRGKSGWFEGAYYDSSYELAFALYNRDQNLGYVRNTTQFDLTQVQYIPDFVHATTGGYVEIKGFVTDKDRLKWSLFQPPLLVLTKVELEPVFDYVHKKYGPDFIQLYEGECPITIKNNTCQVCGDLCKKVYCSRKCAGKGVSSQKR